MRVASLSREIAEAMRFSFNGTPADEIAQRIAAGELALVSHKLGAYAIVSREGDSVCIEAVQGSGGTELTAAIVGAARQHGLTCCAWVLSRARARLAARAGMFATGRQRLCTNGKIQIQVQT